MKDLVIYTKTIRVIHDHFLVPDSFFVGKVSLCIRLTKEHLVAEIILSNKDDNDNKSLCVRLDKTVEPSLLLLKKARRLKSPGEKLVAKMLSNLTNFIESYSVLHVGYAGQDLLFYLDAHPYYHGRGYKNSEEVFLSLKKSRFC